MSDQPPAGLPPVLRGLQALAGRYDGFILDLWGVLHDGERPYPGALDGLERLVSAGKRLCLLSNAPRRVEPVAGMLAGMGIGPGHYHHLMTSGEAAFEALLSRACDWHAGLGRACLHLGPEHDRQLFESLSGVERVDDPARAEFVLNTGPSTYDDTPEDYGPVLALCARRGLPMVCANPDLEVMVGERVVECAGALARRYADLGGVVRYHGKPHPPVYRRCFELLGLDDRRRIVALGDTLHTDIAGAAAAGIDSVLVTGGILLRDLGGPWGEAPPPAALARLLPPGGPRPLAVLARFAW
ncbi:MAG: TIGR01459 family HAD-type hydrolase [Rhodospirillaceae bacterium]